MVTRKKNCPCCGEIWKFEGYPKRSIITLHGAHTIRRRYYRCSACGHNEFPGDKIIGILPGKLSARTVEKACLIAAITPFEQGTDLLERLTGLKISADCLEKTSERVGTLLFQEECKQAEETAEMPIKSNENSSKKPDRMYIMIDGSHLNTREEGWKENKLAMAFSEADIVRSGEKEEERISIRKKDFVSSLGEKLGTFKNLVSLLGHRTGIFLAREVVVIADGAPWIRNLAESLFPKAVIILDWFHVTEHLWGSAKELFGDSSTQRAEWVKRYKDMLWNGMVDNALKLLLQEAVTAKNQTPLRELYYYFNTRRECMRYDKFRLKGYYIGSGPIESANKYVIQERLKRAGMKWTFRGANAIACLRTKYLSGNWDPVWETGSPIYS